MRTLFVATLLALAAPAAAQTPGPAAPAAAPATDVGRVTHLLSANWRPLAGVPGATPEAIFGAACEGAVEEMAALDASIPDAPSAQVLAGVRAPRGFVIVPANEASGMAFIFPNAQLSTITSGPAAVSIVDTAQGRVNLLDAAGHETQLQLGVSNTYPVMRILGSDPNPALYVGCASSVR